MPLEVWVFKVRAASVVLASVSVLAACGGGGGTDRPFIPVQTTPTPGASAGTTSAQGTVVDDPSGTPLAGVAVRLDPWIAYATPGPSPTPIAASTTDPNGHFTVSAPNGTYMLVIGPDAVNTPPPGWSTPAPNATDTPIPGAGGWRATIHDRVVLHGQAVFVAPTLVAQPMYTPPAAETGGAYRLATLDPLLESPCILAYNADRVSLGLPAAVADEWLVENTRAILNSVIAWNTANPAGGDVVQYYTSGTGHGNISGGSNCSQMVSGYMPFSAPSQWGSADAPWFAGSYSSYLNNSQGAGFSAAPIDPRNYVQTNTPPWP